MRKLIFFFALLGCSLRVMAADPCKPLQIDLCKPLQAKCLYITANGHSGMIGPLGFDNASGFLQANVQFSGDALDTMTGSCVNGHAAFTRVHQGQGAYTQFYSGLFSDSSNVSGTYIHGNQIAQHFNWNATAGACPPPPSAANKACVAECQKKQDECGDKPCSGYVYNNCIKACPP